MSLESSSLYALRLISSIAKSTVFGFSFASSFPLERACCCSRRRCRLSSGLICSLCSSNRAQEDISNGDMDADKDSIGGRNFWSRSGSSVSMESGSTCRSPLSSAALYCKAAAVEDFLSLPSLLVLSLSGKMANGSNSSGELKRIDDKRDDAVVVVFVVVVIDAVAVLVAVA